MNISPICSGMHEVDDESKSSIESELAGIIQGLGQSEINNSQLTWKDADFKRLLEESKRMEADEKAGKSKQK